MGLGLEEQSMYLSKSSKLNIVSLGPSSDLVLTVPPKNGAINTKPRTRIGSSSSKPAPIWTATWCAMFPPDESPTTKTRSRSTPSLNHSSQSSDTAWPCSHLSELTASSTAAGSLCSGARRKSGATTSAPSPDARRRQQLWQLGHVREPTQKPPPWK